jgi:hypothetical protein
VRALALLLALAAPAHADLYRWVDPDTGSVKFSNLPPSNPELRAELERRDPAGASRRAAETGALVERLRQR